jgi:hypothetical protein
MKRLKTYKIFEQSKIREDIEDIKDIFLELRDEGWNVKHENFDISSEFAFTDEFFIFKKGKSGYYLDSSKCELFNISEVLNDVLRFVDVCEMYDNKFRIITHDGQYTLDITKKIHNLKEIDKSDVVEETHLHLKNNNKKGIIDLENVKFVSCQILK